MANYTRQPLTFASALEILGRHQSATLRNRGTRSPLTATQLVHHKPRDLASQSECIYVQYHETNVLTFYPNGGVRINHGGWRTATTKARLNQFGPEDFNVSQMNHDWYFSWCSKSHLWIVGAYLLLPEGKIQTVDMEAVR